MKINKLPPVICEEKTFANVTYFSGENSNNLPDGDYKAILSGNVVVVSFKHYGKVPNDVRTHVLSIDLHGFEIPRSEAIRGTAPRLVCVRGNEIIIGKK